LLAQGAMPELQERLGLGDRLSLFFRDGVPELDYARLPGVLTYNLQDQRLDLRVDRAEERLAAILEAVFRTGSRVAQVRLREVDLAEIYHEITH
jgi:hypothetical protein